MSRLEDLEKDVYGTDDARLDKRMHQPHVLPESLDRVPTSWSSQNKKPKRNPLFTKDFFKILLSALGIVVIVTGAVFLFFYLSNKGQEADIEVRAPDKIESGEVVKIPIHFKNISRSVLHDAEIVIVLPLDARVVENDTDRVAPPRIVKKINDLSSGQEGDLEIAARIFGKEGDEKIIEASLLYQPEGLQARFSAKTAKTVSIGHVPLAISWESPSTVSQGQEVEIKVHYISDAALSFEKLALHMEYPSGFSFISADRTPDIGDAIWTIGNLNPHQEGVITFKGKISGDPGETKTFKGSLGVFNETTKELKTYSEATREIKIEASPLSVHAFTAGGRRDYLVAPGDMLHFDLHYKNNSVVALRNVTLHAFLESGPSTRVGQSTVRFPADSGKTLLDLTTLLINDGGVFDSPSKSVVWGPNELEKLRELGPGDEGEVSLSVKVRDSFPIRNNLDRNLVLRLRSVIDTPDVPQELSGTKVGSEDILDLKTRSKVVFSAKSVYKSGSMFNSGPLPPKVGAKTTYTILWEIKNFSNDIQNVAVRTTLPSNVVWENNFSSGGTPLTFDPSSREVLWVSGTIPSSTGILTPTMIGSFQVSIIPSDADVGKTLVLANTSTLKGVDAFTGDGVQAESDAVTTELIHDSSTTFREWKVVR